MRSNTPASPSATIGLILLRATDTTVPIGAYASGSSVNLGSRAHQGRKVSRQVAGPFHWPFLDAQSCPRMTSTANDARCGCECTAGRLGACPGWEATSPATRTELPNQALSNGKRRLRRMRAITAFSLIADGDTLAPDSKAPRRQLPSAMSAVLLDDKCITCRPDVALMLPEPRA
jgi:hypothetical protein